MKISGNIFDGASEQVGTFSATDKQLTVRMNAKLDQDRINDGLGKNWPVIVDGGTIDLRTEQVQFVRPKDLESLPALYEMVLRLGFQHGDIEIQK